MSDDDPILDRVLGELRHDLALPATATATTAANGDRPARGTVADLVDALGAFLHLEDTDHVLFALAVAVASRATTGEPLWGLIVGPASSGKTEAVRMLDDVADEHPDEITGPSLLSWSRSKEPKRVGILARVPNPGFLTVADFSTVLATSDRGYRDQLFSLLRRAYDGHVSRDLGNSPRPLVWSGRLTLLAACTPAIDSFSSHTDALGPRWLYYRIPEQAGDTKRQTGRRAVHAGNLDNHRRRVRELAAGIVDTARDRLATVTLTDSTAARLVDAAIVACYGRAAVERNGYGRREISGLAIVEEPPRIAGQLALLTRSLLALGLPEPAAVKLACRCALDSVPRARLGALNVLAHHEQATQSEVARLVGAHRHVARFALEELEAIGLVCCLLADDDDPDGTTFTPRPWTLTGPNAGLVRRVLADATPPALRGTKSVTNTHQTTTKSRREGRR